MERSWRLCPRPLDDLAVRIIFLDGLHFRDHVVLLALGVDAHGQKHVLALREGTTKNATVCTSLLADLRTQGLARHSRAAPDDGTSRQYDSPENGHRDGQVTSS